MAEIKESIEVNVPVRTAYNQWTQFEDFPRFMEGVEEVKQLDDTHLRWKAEIAGKDVEWTSEITQQDPDRAIAWRSTSGARNNGAVGFQDIGGNRCQVTLTMDYEPEGAAEKAGSMLGAVKMRVKGDLKRFKEFIEGRGTETGAWRGEIRGGESRPQP